jgi:CBS domain-containing protein
MTAELITITPKDSIDFCMSLMTERHIRHLPVVENNNVVGMISIGDVVKSIIQAQQTTIQLLESYITS